MNLIDGVNNIDDWGSKYSPRGKDKQWKDDFSAAEFAKLWFKDGKVQVPPEIQALLNDVFDGATVLKAEPECSVKIDPFRNPPVLDMLMTCTKKDGEKFFCGIEAKCNEPLSCTVSDEFKHAKSPNSKIPERVKNLYEQFKIDECAVDDLRYQIFTALAGTVAAAESNGAKDCMLIVLQIVSDRGINDSTKEDVNAFCRENKSVQILADAENRAVWKINVSENDTNCFLAYLRVNKNV